MTEREPIVDYDDALARVRASQVRLARALAAPHPEAVQGDIVEAARRLMHDMDGLYMVTFSHMIEQINSLQDGRLSGITAEMQAMAERQGRHARLLSDLMTRLERIEKALEFDT